MKFEFFFFVNMKFEFKILMEKFSWTRCEFILKFHELAVTILLLKWSFTIRKKDESSSRKRPRRRFPDLKSPPPPAPSPIWASILSRPTRETTYTPCVLCRLYRSLSDLNSPLASLPSLLLFDHGLASPFVPPLVYCYASYQPSPLAYCYVPPLNDSIINDSAQWQLFQRTPQAWIRG